MGQTLGDRLREAADELDEMGEELRERGSAALGAIVERLEGAIDKLGMGEDLDAPATTTSSDDVVTEMSAHGIKSEGSSGE